MSATGKGEALSADDFYKRWRRNQNTSLYTDRPPMKIRHWTVDYAEAYAAEALTALEESRERNRVLAEALEKIAQGWDPIPCAMAALAAAKDK